MARILFVCTGNLCRSPFADGWFNRALDGRFQVASAGVAATGDAPPERMQQAAAEEGIDLRSHRGRLLTEELAHAAHLLVAMDRAHVLDILGVAPDVAPRVVMLSELSALTASRTVPDATEDLGEWLGSLTRDRHHDELLSPPYEDVVDPMGRSRRAYKRAVEHIVGLGNEIAPRLAGSRRSTDAPSLAGRT